MADVSTLDGADFIIRGVNAAVVLIDPKPDGTEAKQVFVRRGRAIPGRITEAERDRLTKLHVFEEGRPNPVLSEPVAMVDQSIARVRVPPRLLTGEEPRARVERGAPLGGVPAGVDRQAASAGGATGLTIPPSDGEAVQAETAGTPELKTDLGEVPEGLAGPSEPSRKRR